MGALQYEGGLTENPAPGMDNDIVTVNAIRIDVVADFDRFRSSNPHALLDQFLDFIFWFHILKNIDRLALPVLGLCAALQLSVINVRNFHQVPL